MVVGQVFWLVGEIWLGAVVAEGARLGTLWGVPLRVWQALPQVLPQTHLQPTFARGAVTSGRATNARSDGGAATVRNYSSANSEVISYFLLQQFVDFVAARSLARPHTLGYVFG